MSDRNSQPSHRKGSARGRRPEAVDPGWQLTLSAALRARDAAKPSEADLERAEREVEIVRRHWQPPANEVGH